MSLRQRVNAKTPLPPVKRPKSSLRQHVVHSGIDSRRWHTFIEPDEMVQKWRESLFEGNEDRQGYFNAPQLLQDVSYVLYKYRPLYYDQASVKPDAWINRSILDLVWGSGAFDQVREHTHGDVDATSQGVSAIAEVIAQMLEGLEEAIDIANQAKQDAENGDEPDEQALAQAQQQVDEQAQQFQSRMQRALRDLSKNLDKQQSSAQEFGNDPAELGKTDPQTRQSRRDFLKNSAIQDLARRVGRMKRMVTGRHTRSTDNKGYDPVGMELGDNLAQVLDSEWLLFDNEHTDDSQASLETYEFLRKYDVSRLQQFRTREVIDSGMGDVVACVDCSGSMGNNDKLTWAIAVAESVRQIATSQGRDVKIIVFNANVRAEHDFAYNSDFESVMEWLSTDCDGGTNFAKPLDRAMQVIKSDEESTADILMLTDGAWTFNQSWVDNFNQRRHDMGVRTHIVHIEPNNQEGLEQLKLVGDQIIGLDELTDESGSQVMQSVLQI